MSTTVQDPCPASEEALQLPSTEIPETIEETPAVPEAVATKPVEKSPRLQSLDAFRGLSIVLTLLVSNIALDTATPKQLMHAGWNGGIHLADLVFPWFLFAAGVAIPFSAASAKKKGIPGWRYDLKILSRTAALVALGCLVDSSVQHQPLFTLGVLQIIGLAFLVGAFLYELPLFRRVILAVGMLLAYWAIIKFIPAPGMGAGAFEATHNIIYYLNRTYFSAVGLWGITSVVPTAAMMIIGSVIGDLLRNKTLTEHKRLAMLLIVGVVLVAAGFLWNFSLPYNKPLWTPAYVLMTAGLGTLLLGVLYLIVDAAGWWHWTYPLLVLGANAILAYVMPILVKLLILENWHHNLHGVKMSVEQWFLTVAKTRYGAVPGGWVYTLGYILVWWIVLWFFYRKKVFLRV